MTIEEITARIRAFRDARDWMQFHNPIELAATEARMQGESGFIARRINYSDLARQLFR